MSAFLANDLNPVQLAAEIRGWARELGFQQTGFTGIDLAEDERHLLNWLAQGFHGDMEWMQRHASLRSHPEQLLPGTLTVISVRMDYDPPDAAPAWDVLADASLGYVSRYALGRDYHKLVRSRLAKLAKRITAEIGPFGHRAFTDSAPVLEKALARNAGLGWIGKHSNLLNAHSGSWFFLGELYTDLALPHDTPATDHCGSCRRCIDACPTGAIVASGQVDARRCISYLTIELATAIPEQYRRAMGNRIYGCDDCQLVCPFNSFSSPSTEADFQVRHKLDASGLVELFAWSQAQFNERMAGSAMRRIGYAKWLRNIAVALGNAPGSEVVIDALRSREHDPSSLVREHVIWALKQHLVATTAPGDGVATPI